MIKHTNFETEDGMTVLMVMGCEVDGIHWEAQYVPHTREVSIGVARVESGPFRVVATGTWDGDILRIVRWEPSARVTPRSFPGPVLRDMLRTCTQN